MEAPQGAGGEKAVERGSHRGGFGVSGGHVGLTVVAGRGSRVPREEEAGEGEISEGEEAALGASELRAFSGNEGLLVVKRSVYKTVPALSFFFCLLSLASLLFSFSVSSVLLWRGGVREQESGAPQFGSQ